MFYQVLRILLSFVTIFYCVNGENVPQKNDKRVDIDLQMCVESFDVHKNKIIRTEDSQEMGAKYINEIDLDSRKECLRLCCETEQCDVFVFEEKRPGSCYLFHCGPPDDFKCKFTSHANYTSAVLTMNLNSRSTVELEEQIRRTQQDHDLQSLRKLADNSPAEYSVLEPTVSAVTEMSKVVIITTAASVKPACSRNQFECRTSGDCIAIYNACDGIPQCADGSDEASELGCPTKKPSMPPPIVIQQQPLSAPANSAKYQPSMQHHKPYDAAYGHEEKDSRAWQLSGHQLAPQQERIQYPQQVVISQPQVNLGSQRYQWEYQPLYEQSKENFNSINSFRGPSNTNPYEQQSHIFNHKGPGVIGEGGDGSAYIDQNRQYVPYYPPDNGNWQEGQPQQPPSISPTQQNIPSLMPKLQPQITAKPPLCNKDDENKGNTPPITDVVQSSKSIGQKNSIIPKAKIEIHDSVTSEINKKSHHNIADTAKPHKHSETKIFVEQSNEEIKGHLTMDRLQDSNEDRDLRPRGAVISLALGLTTTALMAALIACRLRMVRRRGRRGHGPYAHDADYLVNGMYL
ncbi:uncharacterized protein LOC124406582 isoform X2 [Diprion similis]|uniref:uncharacterized protein LOC124406582 isoform X2 n=1 Tax=Diprion similis TaxID=362088 RepID=UPI001EF8F2F3|nr:uncharacterized protein LOC124406582 isoform X2 [Diprion similis]